MLHSNAILASLSASDAAVLRPHLKGGDAMVCDPAAFRGAALQSESLISTVIGAYLEPGHEQDPRRTIETIMLVMDRADVVGAAERVLAGYIGPVLVK